MHHRTALTLLLITLSAAAQAEVPRVELELYLQDRASATSSRQWIEVLSKAGVANIRFATSARRVPIEVKNLGTKDRPSFKVTGVVSAQNVLTVPGGRFRLSDRAKIAAWLKGLGQADERAAAAARNNAFGISAEQFAQVQQDLAKPLKFSTQGVAATSVINSINRMLTSKLAVNPSAKSALDPRTKVLEELEGLSAGAVLAIVLRPAGLMFRPRERNGQLEYYVTTSTAKSQPWPIGWPAEKRPRDLVPKLYEFTEYEIEDFELPDVLAAVQESLGVPFVYDQNSMARHKIEIDKVKVTLGTGKTYNRKLLSLVLNKAGLKYDLRVDEAGKPFCWITTRRR
jgi:hypothetical protein